MKRTYSESAKVKALALTEKIGVARAARQLGIPEGSINNWRYPKRIARAAKKAPGIITGDTDQIRALERENDRLMRFIFKKIVVPMLDEQ